ncbi:mechanosensitive ion channel family protein [Alteromonas australica]|jgi:small-conductance mechanosensitive channel|uniref:Mechanosensitive ion channel protein n=3 Tax=Alteromonas australica TaxID=589873 RepID=A0A075P2F9_9ALTE|nr:mechanosensitive ion channel domain-containing protein [Alteromonas australica]AIG00027.1 mechanosensitive ion channel protein [Alteromonas australica]MBU34940.1 mechanosensitive ion channel protein [Alteromonas sp.]HAI71103.1 mechanosensitive ion channel protein [Alteromonas australica]HBU51062.1 mechanosensitive ion channel protein [Alteromonas australica]|tara:strand:+ start:16378 stop:17700 length:1323 start_codon:yes stop_codon:yes gene_type:complete
MNVDNLVIHLDEALANIKAAIYTESFAIQLLVLAAIYLVSFLASRQLKYALKIERRPQLKGTHTLYGLAHKASDTLFPIITISALKLTSVLSEQYQFDAWLLNVAIVVAVMLFVNSLIRIFVENALFAGFMRYVAMPVLFLHLVGVLPVITDALQSISISIGNVNISAYGVTRVFIFGGLLFWLGRASNTVGQNIIRNHNTLDGSTKEVFAKLFEVALFCIVFLLLLNVMGINLTALAVFGGALGVGLGLGLQSIASNFISGIIILLDRSLTVGDYVELEDGQKGIVREFKMRYAVLETFDGKDILVPNEKFISSLLINWTHKDPKQRYRIDFSVAYKTDIRAMVDIIKDAVSQHPQVISGDAVPFEERPDCEIDSFGDSGVNMFVEFWIEGVDDGKNRVGGDLLLTVFETLKEHGIEIPFPQREVRVLNEGPSIKETTP